MGNDTTSGVTTVPSLAHNLKAQRAEKGLSQPQLAEKADVNKDTISLIESGRVQRPQAKTLGRLAAALETTVLNLMGEST